MNTDAITQPSISHRSRRRFVLVALATMLAVGVAGAVVIDRSSGGTSGQHVIARPPEVMSGSTSPDCRVDMDYLAAEVGTMPETVRPGVVAALSPEVRQLVDRAIASQTAIGAGALQYGFTYSPPVPDGPTLARVLAAIPAADAHNIVSALSPERRAEVGTSSAAASSAGTPCP